MATTRIIQDNPVYQEAHYSSRETERLTTAWHNPTVPLLRDTPTPAYLPQDVRPLVGIALLVIGLIAVGLAIRSIVAAAIFSAGYAAGHAVGVVQPWIDARGWVALLVFSIAGTSAMIRYSNARRG